MHNKSQSALDHYRSLLAGAGPERHDERLLFAHNQNDRPSSNTTDTDFSVARVNGLTLNHLKEMAQENEVTVFHTILAAYQTYLFQFIPAQTADNILVCVSEHKKRRPVSKSNVHQSSDVLPVLFERAEGKKFVQALQQTKSHLASAACLSTLSSNGTSGKLEVPDPAQLVGMSRFFMSHKLAAQNGVFEDYAAYSTDNVPLEDFEVALEVLEHQKLATVKLVVPMGLFRSDITQSMANGFVYFLKQLADAGGEVEAGWLKKWDPADIHIALEKGMGPNLDLEWPSTVTSRIDQIISLNADRPALQDGYGQSLTYRAMDQRIDSISTALGLAICGIADAQPIVGVFQQPSADWMCSLLAIFRSGCVYLPLDLRNSTPRLRSHVEAAQPTVILADRETLKRRAELDPAGKILFINVSDLARSRKPKLHWRSPSSEASAYIIFTSGSTGEPKGIVVQHAGLRANLEGYHRAWKIEKCAQVVLQQTVLSSDVSLVQIFAALTTGGCLVVVPAESRGDPAEVTTLMLKHGVTMTQATPSEYDMWFRFAAKTLHKCHHWRTAWVGGESARPGLLEGFRSACSALPQLRVFTSYGPKESTISVMKGNIDMSDDNLSIPVPGQVLPNYRVYIADEDGRPQPIGIPGEILIGGKGVGGNIYLDSPKLTREVFCPDTIAPASSRGQGELRLCKTGDYGTLDARGYLKVEGRISGDTQVKLLGFRIELQGIERVMLQEANGAVTAAVVTLRDGNNGHGPHLVAHIVLDRGFSADVNELVRSLRARLPQRLPQYMCPTTIAFLDELPLTIHQKLDRRAVKALAIPEAHIEASHTPQNAGKGLPSPEARLS